MTPLQMANCTVAIANQGFYFIPHIVKYIDGKINYRFVKKAKTKIDKEYFVTVIKGMEKVVTSGTATNIQKTFFSQAGKTGTSQVPYGKDHSNFIMFAPIKNPKIVVAVVIQNGGFGSRTAAPIASLIAEKYLYKKIHRIKMEQSVKSMNFYDEYKKNYIYFLNKHNKNKKINK